MRLIRKNLATAAGVGLLASLALHTPAFAQEPEEAAIQWWQPVALLGGLGLAALLVSELSNNDDDASPPVSP